MMFESYYDEYMQQWSVRNTETLEMYPVTSENMANEFTNLLNKYDEKYIDEYSLRETVQIDLQKIAEENEQLKQTCQMVEDTYHALQKKFHNWDIALDKCRNENKELKRQLDNVDDCLTRDDMVMLRAERGFE